MPKKRKGLERRVKKRGEGQRPGARRAAGSRAAGGCLGWYCGAEGHPGDMPEPVEMGPGRHCRSSHPIAIGLSSIYSLLTDVMELTRRVNKEIQEPFWTAQVPHRDTRVVMGR